MALGTVDKVGSVANAGSDSLVRQIAVELNALAAAVNAIAVKLDADAGVTDTDYEDEIDVARTVNTITIDGSAPS